MKIRDVLRLPVSNLEKKNRGDIEERIRIRGGFRCGFHSTKRGTFDRHGLRESQSEGVDNGLFQFRSSRRLQAESEFSPRKRLTKVKNFNIEVCDGQKLWRMRAGFPQSIMRVSFEVHGNGYCINPKDK